MTWRVTTQPKKLVIQRGNVKSVIATGPQGVAGSHGAATDWVPPVANTVWTIVHNKGYKPVVWVEDQTGEVVGCTIDHPDINTTRITFAVAFMGTAHLL